MKNTLKFIGIIVLFIVIVLPVAASDFIYGLNDEGNGIIIRNYTGTNPHLVIPARIEGIPVVQVGSGQHPLPEVPFGGRIQGRPNFLQSVVIPEGVRVIARDAFRRQENLTRVTFPSTLTHIGWAAFDQSGLINVDLSRTSLTEIVNHSFQSSYNLRTVKLPDSVTVIGTYAFSGCSSLTEINIPARIIEIRHAFGGCTNITNLIIPSSITEIKWTPYATWMGPFRGCGKLPIATRQRLINLGYHWNDF